MKQTSMTRRLVAGAVGLMIGAIGAVAFSAPAHATGGKHKGDQLSQVYFKNKCDGIKVMLKSGDILDDYAWTITEVDGDGVWTVDLAAGEHDSVLVESQGTITVNFAGSPNTDWVRTWTEPTWKNCDDGEGGEEEEEEEEGEEEELPQLTDAVFFGCDLFVVGIRNDGEEDGVSLSLSPNEDATHGHAPEFVDLIDEAEGDFEIPEGFELDVVGDLAAGESFDIEDLGVGDAHAHGFEPFEGLVVTATVSVGEEEIGSVELDWVDLLDSRDIECEEEDEGEGGELPATGLSTGMIALGALALLAVGGGLFLVARRRRVTFSA